jgi:hypothetical protein
LVNEGNFALESTHHRNAVCAVLVLFAENVIRPRSMEPAEAVDLAQSNISKQAGTQ